MGDAEDMLQVYRDGIKLWVRYESVGRDGYRDDYTCFIHIHKQIYFLSEPSLSGAYLNKTKSFIYLRISYLSKQIRPKLTQYGFW